MNTLGPLIIDLKGTAITPHEKEMLSHPLVGGVILFTRNFESIEQLHALVEELRALRNPSLLITVDHEGGRVQRFRKSFTELPPLKLFGDLYEESPQRACELAQQTGWLMATELKVMGIDLSYAPVLDIDRKLNTVIGDRSFHENPAIIITLAKAFIKGMREGGMLAVGKHFPGHGGVSEDSHVAIPQDIRSQATLREEDLMIFKTLIKDHQLGAIMPAHVCYTQWDEMPPTFSSYWLKTILREELGFSGLIISDDLSMEGASMVGDYCERAERAHTAGCDMMLLCNHPEAVEKVLGGWRKAIPDLSAILETFKQKPSLSTSSLGMLQKESLWKETVEALQCLELSGEH